MLVIVLLWRPPVVSSGAVRCSGMLEKNRDTFRDDILNLLRESRNKQDTLKSSNKHRRPTVSSQFKVSSVSLRFFEEFNPRESSCKLGSDLTPSRYSGMLETVKIRRTGFPIRRPFEDFCSRYKVLMRGVAVQEDPRAGCVFLRESLEHRLEKQREMVLRAAMIIQAHVTGYIARSIFNST
ncbi:hypothetical protein F7725_010988 [Dissostichus mawsoni]|uniref:Uncharacterized protein n=1 Tax=Dissostichus mawsoni TaxID=36200 RepID=A0A7J5ZAV2_DISMA|nr:hypothetical protein F7725_010988 [Dissostichus mawsoni]